MKNEFESLKKILAKIAEDKLSKFSGQNKVLEVLTEVHFKRNLLDTFLGPIYTGQPYYFKIVFWHPGNAMLVGYTYGEIDSSLSNEFTISPNHDSTWKYDGLSFFGKILAKPEACVIKQRRLLEVEEVVVGDKFTFVEKSAMVI